MLPGRPRRAKTWYNNAMLELSQSEHQPARAPEEPHIGAPPTHARTKTSRGQRALWFFTAHYVFSVVLGLIVSAFFAPDKAPLLQILGILTVGPVVFLLAPYEFMPIGLYSVTHGTLHLAKGATHAMRHRLSLLMSPETGQHHS